jgi:hypothetical protein
MYGFVEKFSDNALLVFRFEDPDNATKILADKGVKVVTRREIEGL